jgi:hypothetical protein
LIGYFDTSALVKLFVLEQRPKEALNRNWEKHVRVEFTPALARSSGETADAYRLRGFSSNHLATALSLRDRIQIPLVFVVCDQRLRSAALSTGLEVRP